MRLLFFLAAVVAVAPPAAQADLQQLAAVLPSCAMNCLVKCIPESRCAPTDQVCICTDPDLTSKIRLCVETSCTIREALTTQNITETACGAPVRNRTKAVSVTGVVGGVVAFIVFCLRMISRLPCFGGQFGMDDWTMILTMTLLIPFTALSVVLADAGLGMDMWNVPFDNITKILYIYWIDESIYVSILPLTKISICYFYLRIFPKRSFCIATYVLIALNVAYIIVFVSVSVFQCQPIRAAWLRWDGSYADARCNSENKQAWASAAINMILDIMTMSLPLVELSKLTLKTKKKVFVMLMFSVGFFVTIVSIVRLSSLVEFANTQNVTWDYVPVGYWSTVECDVGVICACLPSIRSLLVQLFPRVFSGSTNQGTTGVKASLSRSTPAASRLDTSRFQNGDDSDFIPLVDRDHGSQVHLTRPEPV
ncbi:hypothetical protein VTN02DRAFT_5106 [Thermoascus thermophilus]